MAETLFERTNREREEAAGLRPKAAAPAPASDKPTVDFFKAKPVDPELKALQDKARARLLRERG